MVPPGPLGYLTIWPTGTVQPTVSTLNSFDGSVVANAAIVPAGTNGAVNVYASHATDFIIDINGYFTPQAGAPSYTLYAIAPCRLTDTRAGSGFTGSFGPPLLSRGVARDFPVLGGSCGIPGNAVAYSANVTVVPPGPLGYLTLWPAGSARPMVSTLNSFLGRVVANAAIVPAGAAGAISTFASNDTELIIDLNGYFAPPGTNALRFYPVTPCRVADTRPSGGFSGAFGPPIMAGASTRAFPIPSSTCNIPATAQAYSLNVTVVPSGSLGYLTLWPTGQTQPLVSTLNSWTGLVVANAAIVPAGTSGSVNVYVSNATDVILDINGYFAP